MSNLEKGTESDELGKVLGCFLISLNNISNKVSGSVEEIIYFKNGLNSKTSIREIYFANNDDGKCYNTRIINLLLSYFFDIYKQNLLYDEDVYVDSIEYLGNLIDIDLEDFSKRPGVSLKTMQRVKYIKESLIMK